MMSYASRRGFCAFALSLLFCVLAAKADQIVLKDGDRITGEIVKKDGDTVTMKSKNFGTVTLKWADIATITTDQAITVALPDDQTVKAKLETRDGKIEVGQKTVEPAAIVALRNDAEQKNFERLQHPRLFDLWTVTGSLNIAGTKGNAQTSTLTIPINFLRVSNTSRTTAYFNAIRATATVNNASAQTAKAIRGGWGYSRNLNKRLFVNTFNDYEYDAFQSLDLRVVLGGGLGYQIWNTDAKRLAVVGGISWNREAFSPVGKQSFTRNSAEAYWGDDFNYKLSKRAALVQGFRMFNNLTNSGEYRINFDLGVSTTLTKWLTWNVALSDRFLSNPVAGRQKNDFLYTTGFGFAFAR